MVAGYVIARIICLDRIIKDHFGTTISTINPSLLCLSWSVRRFRASCPHFKITIRVLQPLQNTNSVHCTVYLKDFDEVNGLSRRRGLLSGGSPFSPPPPLFFASLASFGCCDLMCFVIVVAVVVLVILASFLFSLALLLAAAGDVSNSDTV